MRVPDFAPRSFLLVALTLPDLSIAAQQDKAPDFRVELDASTCQFSGGTDGLGNVEADSNSGAKKIQVKLSKAGNYSIDSVEYSGDGADQMSNGEGSKVVNIHNRNSGPADVKYSVRVRNDDNGEITDCDPRIINH